MKSLLEPVDNINRVNSNKKKPQVPTLDRQSGKKILCKFCGYEHNPGKVCKRCKKKNHFAKGCKDVTINAIENEKDLEAHCSNIDVICIVMYEVTSTISLVVSRGHLAIHCHLEKLLYKLKRQIN